MYWLTTFWVLSQLLGVLGTLVTYCLCRCLPETWKALKDRGKLTSLSLSLFSTACCSLAQSNISAAYWIARATRRCLSGICPPSQSWMSLTDEWSYFIVCADFHDASLSSFLQVRLESSSASGCAEGSLLWNGSVWGSYWAPTGLGLWQENGFRDVGLQGSRMHELTFKQVSGLNEGSGSKVHECK